MGTTARHTRTFTEDEIIRITSNYSTLIGQGGFGRSCSDDFDVVAVKRYIRKELREEFMEEVSIHRQMSHKNVVKLIGYCIGESTNDGCAEALGYMHSMHLSSDSLVNHGDIKPANILLDGNLTAKVSDFGLARLLLGGITQYTRRLTPKSDVYSFGAVLLEIIARKRIKQGNCSLISTFSNACGKGESLRKLFDAEIASKAFMKILEEIGKLATECLILDIHKRPKISDVAKRLLVLWKALQGGQEKGELLLRTQNVGTSSFNCTGSVGHCRNKSLGVFETDVVDPDILIKLGNMRFFTVGELNEITKNFSNLVGEDWLAEVDVPIFIHEYAANSTLSDLLNGTKCFPLELRLQIAIRTAKALAYMHSSDSGCIRHASVNPSNILLDDNFMRKVSAFSLSRRLTKDYDYAGSVVVYRNYSDPNFVQTGLLTVKSDVYSFGVILFELITRKISTYDEKCGLMDLVTKYKGAYQSDNRGVLAMFDKDIKATEDIILLDEIGRLATECTKLESDEKPTMKEVAERLEKLRASWKTFWLH
uniref:Protein kinase domain-containing protein n=1 Tax=Setaria viridis TaxID=4556 RepID=A0A4V6D350_SETVI|nr:hypothetical protein SEVIR_8G163800v2 [Setaria viridis]